MLSGITHYFSAHSLFAFFGFEKLLSIAEEHGLPVVHRPIDLHEVMEAAGSSPFATRTREHVRYFFGLEARRWASMRRVEWLGRIPKAHSKPYHRANRLLIAAELRGGENGALAWELLKRHWQEGADLADDAVFESALASVGLEAEPLIAEVESEAVARAYEAYTEEAKAKSVFGSPTYFLDDEMFYGQDRLEMMEWRIEQESEAG
ncbi:MAG: 2-hydroxychromene-2-carboxylate isomerase [Acidobacteriota bacterium]